MAAQHTSHRVTDCQSATQITVYEASPRQQWNNKSEVRERNGKKVKKNNLGRHFNNKYCLWTGLVLVPVYAQPGVCAFYHLSAFPASHFSFAGCRLSVSSNVRRVNSAGQAPATRALKYIHIEEGVFTLWLSLFFRFFLYKKCFVCCALKGWVPAIRYCAPHSTGWNRFSCRHSFFCKASRCLFLFCVENVLLFSHVNCLRFIIPIKSKDGWCLPPAAVEAF